MQRAQVERMGLENYLANQTGGAGAGLAEVLTIRSIAQRSLIMLMTGPLRRGCVVRMRECATSGRDVK